MKVSKYYILDAKSIEDWEFVKTKGQAFKAAEQVRAEGLYEPVILKVVKEKVEPEVEVV